MSTPTSPLQQSARAPGAVRPRKTPSLTSPAGSFSLKPGATLEGEYSAFVIGPLLDLFPTALLVEPAATGSLPDYGSRRNLRATVVTSRSSRNCLIFADPAHSAFVVTWRSDPSRVLLEFRVPGAEQALAGALEDERRRLHLDARGGGVLTANAPPRGLRRRSTRRVSDDPARAILLTVRDRMAPGCAATVESMVGFVEEVSSAEALRRAWAVLEVARILDRSDDPDAGWLLAAAQVLEPVYLALACRTRSFVADVRADGKRRPEHLRDLRTRLDRIDSGRGGPGQAVAIRRLVVRQNLFALRGNRRSARNLRRRLCAYAEWLPKAVSYLDCNVSWLPERPEPRSSLAVELDIEGPDAAAGAASQRDAAWLPLRLAWEIARRRRGSELEDDDADGDAALQLDRRRRQLLRNEGCPDSEACAGEVVSAAAFPWLADAEFDLVGARVGLR